QHGRGVRRALRAQYRCDRHRVWSDAALTARKGDVRHRGPGTLNSLPQVRPAKPEIRKVSMATVRVLVGTRKGAFVITGDGSRRDWKIEGPHFGGWEVMHVKGSPVNPERIYASQWTDWHG